MTIDLRLPVSNLFARGTSSEPKVHDFEVPAGSYDDLTLPSSLHGTVILELVDKNSIRVQIVGTGSLQLICDRCLEPFNFPVKVTINEVMIPSRDEIDLGPQIWEELHLITPMKILCRINCPGIEIDPKFATQTSKES